MYGTGLGRYKRYKRVVGGCGVIEVVMDMPEYVGGFPLANDEATSLRVLF